MEAGEGFLGGEAARCLPKVFSCEGGKAFAVEVEVSCVSPGRGGGVSVLRSDLVPGLPVFFGDLPGAE